MAKAWLPLKSLFWPLGVQLASVSQKRSSIPADIL
jgi:hypothetical protein